jgi:signal transduction histidine kinase
VSERGDPLAVVARAVAQMNGEPQAVPRTSVRAMLELGFDAAAFRVLDVDSTAHRVLESANLDEDREDRASLSGAITDLVLESGRTVVAGTTVAPALPSGHGFDVAIACPVWVEGWIAAVLVGAATSAAVLTSQVEDAVGVIGAHAGLTLGSVQIAEEERQLEGQLEAGDRLKTEFLTTISHELRTPLTALKGTGTTLERAWSTLRDEERRELLARVNANIGVLDDMLGSLLDFARLEAGELWVSFEPFDISRVVRTACAGIPEESEGRQLVTDVEDGLLASGDVVLIRRVVSALVSNAVTHTSRGTSVLVSCRRRNGEVVVEVTDEGPGIAPADLPFLGERFFRGGRSNERPRGLGLGLALARGILDLHEAELLVRSEPSRGTTFSFSLPWVSDPAASEPPAGDGADAEAYAPGDGRA